MIFHFRGHMKKKQLVTKSIKFDKDKLRRAKKIGRIRELAARCRKQLDELLGENENG